MGFTLKDVVKKDFIDFLMLNKLNTGQKPDGKFETSAIQSMWVANIQGANCALNVMKSRINEASEQKVWMQARIRELEAEVASMKQQ